MEIIAETVFKSPQSSARKVSREVDISDRSLKRMLHSDIRFKFEAVQANAIARASRRRPDRRVEFLSNIIIIRQEANNDFYKRILWSDEATFKVNARINRTVVFIGPS